MSRFDYDEHGHMLATKLLQKIPLRQDADSDIDSGIGGRRIIGRCLRLAPPPQATRIRRTPANSARRDRNKWIFFVLVKGIIDIFSSKNVDQVTVTLAI